MWNVSSKTLSYMDALVCLQNSLVYSENIFCLFYEYFCFQSRSDFVREDLQKKRSHLGNLMPPPATTIFIPAVNKSSAQSAFVIPHTSLVRAFFWCCCFYISVGKLGLCVPNEVKGLWMGLTEGPQFLPRRKQSKGLEQIQFPDINRAQLWRPSWQCRANLHL